MSGWGSGYLAGVGKAMGQQAHDMLEAELSRYKGLADVYGSIFNNPSIKDPAVRQEALRRMTHLRNVNPRDPKSLKLVKGYEDTSAIWNAHNASVTGQGQGEQPSLEFQALASGDGQASSPEMGFKQQLADAGMDPEMSTGIGRRIDELMAGVPKPSGPFRTPEDDHYWRLKSEAAQQALKEAMMEWKMTRGGVDFAQGVPQTHPIYNKITKLNRSRFMMDQPMEEFQSKQVAGRPAGYWGPTNQYFIGDIEIDPNTAVMGDGGRVSIQKIIRDNMGVEVGRETLNLPYLPAMPQPVPSKTPGMAPPQPGTVPQPQVPAPAPRPAGGLPGTPGVAPTANADPAAAGGPPALNWEYGGEEYLAKYIPDTADPEVASLARWYAGTLDESAVKQVNSNPTIRNKVGALLRAAKVYTPTRKELEAIHSLDDGANTIQTLGSLMREVRAAAKTGDNNLLAEKARVLHGQIMSLGSVFAKTNFLQTGQLSNQEQIWSRKGFMGALESMMAGKAKAFFNWDVWENAGKEGISDVMRMNMIRRNNFLKGKPIGYIAGYGPADEFMRFRDPEWREKLYPSSEGPPMFTPEQQKYYEKFKVQRP